MKRAWFFGTVAVLLLGVAWAQFTPPPMGLYIKPGSTWTPAATASSAGQVSFSPPPAGAYCKNASSGQWAPCTTLGGTDVTGSGGTAGQIPIANGDGTFTWSPLGTPVNPPLYSSTATVPFTNFARANTAGFYRVCGYIATTVAATAGTAQLFAGYTGDGRAYTPALVGSALTVTAVGANQTGCTVFYADASANISYSVQLVGVTGTPTFRYVFAAEKIF